MSKLFENGKNLESKTTEILERCDKLLDLAFKASGNSITDVIETIADCEDIESTAKIVGCYANLYKDAKELSMMQAQTMDKMISDFEELKRANKILIEQNTDMMTMLCEMNSDCKRLIIKEAKHESLT